MRCESFLSPTLGGDEKAKQAMAVVEFRWHLPFQGDEDSQALDGQTRNRRHSPQGRAFQ